MYCLQEIRDGQVWGGPAPAAAAQRADAADDLDRLGGVREAQAGDGGDLQGPDLDAAWPWSRVRSMTGMVRHAGWRAGRAGLAGWP